LAWTIEISRSAAKAIAKLGSTHAGRVVAFLRERVATAENPRFQGKALKGPLGEFWRYQVGDVRVICDIQDGRLTVLVVKVGDRKDVYRGR
jgi:mRNA interferase RelE/StbE